MYNAPGTNTFSLYDPHKTGFNALVPMTAKISNEENMDKSNGGNRYSDLLCRAGKLRDKDAFAKIYDYYAPRIKSFLMRGGLSADIADELAQETMLTVWHKAESFDPKQAAASTWIFTIARNKKIDYLRKYNRPDPDQNDPLVAGEQPVMPDQDIQTEEQENALSKAIKDLPEEQSFLIQKSFFEDKTHSEIAQETNIPLGTVKSRLRLALERLRHSVKDQDL